MSCPGKPYLALGYKHCKHRTQVPGTPNSVRGCGALSLLELKAVLYEGTLTVYKSNARGYSYSRLTVGYSQ